MSAVIDVQGLVKRFADRELFRVDRLAFEAGQRYALTGRNGTGKSTLLRILAGLEPAQAGTLMCLGERIPAAALPRAYPKAWRRRIVYVHQHPYMFDTQVFDNAAYGLKSHGLWHAGAAERVAAALRWGGLAERLQTPSNKLSGGEKQCLALVRALVLEPDVLMLDEPTANLDGEARERVLALIDDLGHQGRTLIVVTHDRDLLGSREFHRLKLADGHLETR